MSTLYNLYNLEAPFKQYLLAGNAKPVSIKNYLSDFRHFAGFFVSVIPSVVEGSLDVNSKKKISDSSTPPPAGGSARNDIVALITANLISEYKAYLQKNGIPPKTINRRLSTLRKFCSFAISQGWMKENAAKKVANVIPAKAGIQDDVVTQFHHDNETIDLVDINEFFAIINS